ncbi:undecaprenyldiphospho-muramoylpentapeptide beta-N-acetylglucosaminyltransferase [Nitrospira sp. Kam-Ns4a]
MTIVIAAGGTGGHLYPGVSLAREFLRQAPGSSVLFVGTVRGIEATVLPREGFELAMIDARPVMGRGLRGALAGLSALPGALGQARRLLRERRADLVIGIGGYTSPPVLAAAAWLGVRRALLEPNAYPGMANRVLGPLADRVFLAYETAKGHFDPRKTRVVGAPVRREFYEGGEGPETRGEADRVPRAAGQRTLLVFGGSQGAQAINQAMIQALGELRDLRGALAVIHQTGEADRESVKRAYEAAGFQAEVAPFLYDMPRALRAADLVVCRAGAVTLAELAVCGKPAILIPLPTAIRQHQERNARVVAAAGAAVVLRQRDLTGPALAGMVRELLEDGARLRAMGERSRALGRPDSAEVIVRECLQLVKGAPVAPGNATGAR